MPALAIRPRKLTSASQYLNGTVDSDYLKRRIRADFKRSLSDAGLLGESRPMSGLNDTKRALFADSIFRVEDALESKNGGQPDHPDVVQLRAARQRVNQDLRWDDA